MEVTHPIKDKKMITKIKNELYKQSTRNGFLVSFAINSGLRISDILALKVSDVRNQGAITLFEGKTKKRKVYPLSNANFKAEIQRYTRDMDIDGWLFPSRIKDRPISRMQANRILASLENVKGIEMKISAHSLRKTWGYHYFKHASDRTQALANLQHMFNHTSSAVTLVYIGITDEEIAHDLETLYL